MKLTRRVDPRLPNRHLFVTGTTGSFKSGFVRELDDVRNGPRVLAWDPGEDYAELTRYRDLLAFGEAVTLAIVNGLPARAALTVDQTPENFALFCRLVWALCSAERPMVVIVEELQQVQASAGKASPAWNRISSQGRKYGIRLITITPRPEEVDKTVYSNSAFKWCGSLETAPSRARMAKELGTTAEDLEQLRAVDTPAGRRVRWVLKTPTGLERGERIFPGAQVAKAIV